MSSLLRCAKIAAFKFMYKCERATCGRGGRGALVIHFAVSKFDNESRESHKGAGMQTRMMVICFNRSWKPKEMTRARLFMCITFVGAICLMQACRFATSPASIEMARSNALPLMYSRSGCEAHESFEASPDKLSPAGGPCTTIETFSADIRKGVNTSSINDFVNGCLRSSHFPRSVISKETAARIRCTSSFSNTMRRPRARQCGHKNTGKHSAASICVFYLNYRNLDNLVTSVQSHVMRAHNPDLISHTVLTMDEDEGEVNATRRAIHKHADVHRLAFPPETRGGEPLPIALRLMSLLSACPLTVVSDSDAFMLADGWDVRLMTRFLDPHLSVFAANPRHSSHGAVFRDVAEWNWMAFRTQSFAGLVIGGSGSVALPDVGHYFTECAKAMNTAHIHLQGTLWPYKGKAATVVTDTDGSPWILHLFYASRHNNEPDDIKSEARKYSLNDSQLAELRINLTRKHCLDPTEAFGLTRL